MINIAELLEDAPEGMKLYSPLFGEVGFKYVEVGNIIVKDKYGFNRIFSKDGKYFMDYDSECLLFPSKDCRTWEGWKVPVEPKFKIGDEIKTGNTIETIAEIGYATRSYYCESGRTISFKNQDLWHLVPKPHYDIANFHAGMPVLVRDYNNSQWSYVQFSHLIAERNVGEGGFKFNACGIPYIQCVPFNEDTKYLLGTTDPCDEQYINW